MFVKLIYFGDSDAWIEGHGRSAYEQNTQQSPVLGRSVVAQAGQSLPRFNDWLTEAAAVET
jgi:hypothetical protein